MRSMLLCPRCTRQGSQATERGDECRITTCLLHKHTDPWPISTQVGEWTRGLECPRTSFTWIVTSAWSRPDHCYRDQHWSRPRSKHLIWCKSVWKQSLHLLGFPHCHISVLLCLLKLECAPTGHARVDIYPAKNPVSIRSRTDQTF